MMKSTGIVRKVDELGRVVIPKELRNTHGLDVGSPFEIFVEGERIIFKKYQPACTFCDSAVDIKRFKGKRVCKRCIESMQRVE